MPVRGYHMFLCGWVKISSILNPAKSVEEYPRSIKSDPEGNYWIKVKHLEDVQYFYRIRPEPSYLRKDHQFVYLVTSDLYNGVKIGRWAGGLVNLWSRYQSLLPNMVLILGQVKDHKKSEKNMHDKFCHYNLQNEVFKKKGLSRYIQNLHKISKGNMTAHTSRLSLT